MSVSSCFFIVVSHSSGLVQPGVQPLLSLQVDASRRPVLEVHPASVLGSAAAAAMAASGPGVEIKYAVDFDYPCTIFLAFAVLCAIEAHRQD